MINDLLTMTFGFDEKQQPGQHDIALICRVSNSVLASRPISFDNEGLARASG